MMGRYAEAIEAEREDREDGAERAAAERPVPGADIAAELMRAAWAGDQDTFDRLFDVWFAVLYAEAWRSTGEPQRAAERARELAIERLLAAAERPLRRPLG